MVIYDVEERNDMVWVLTSCIRTERRNLLMEIDGSNIGFFRSFLINLSGLIVNYCFELKHACGKRGKNLITKRKITSDLV